MTVWLVWISLFLLAYHYLLYPLAVVLLASVTSRRGTYSTTSQSSLPCVTLVIAAFNEEKVIARKIDNSLALNYPEGLLQIIVVSDGSSDSTPTICLSYSGRGVVSMHEPTRRGKTAALNRGVSAASGDILLFSDANNDYNQDAIHALVRHFQDPTVGGVCGIKRIREADDRQSSKGDSLYWRYESSIKLAESRLGSITNGDGEIFAIRRALYVPMDEIVINDDAELTLHIIRQGYRVLYEPRAESYEYASIDIRDDFHVKVRMVAGGFQTLARHALFLLPPRNWFTLAFFSHKFLRWTAPIFLISLMGGCLSLADLPIYKTLLGVQLAFYALAVTGWVLRRRQHLPIAIYVPFYFCTMNTAALFGLFRYLRRSQKVQWHKAKR